jgi:uncharacterized membrane protein
MKKKGQVQTLAPAILALVFAAVVLIFGLVISQSIRDTDVITQSQTDTVINETLTTVTETGETFVTSTDRGASGFSLSRCINATGGELIEAVNYTFTAATATIVCSSCGAFNNTDWNCDYTYSHGDEAYVAANDTLVGLGTFADFWEIIVLAIIISLVIGILLVTFSGRGRR